MVLIFIVGLNKIVDKGLVLNQKMVSDIAIMKVQAREKGVCILEENLHNFFKKTHDYDFHTITCSIICII